MSVILAWIAGSRTVMIALLCALVMAVGLNGIQALRLAHEQRDHAQDKASFADQVANAERQGRKDTEAAKAEGERRFKDQVGITNEAIATSNKNAANAVTAAAESGKLQKRVRDLLDRLSATPSNPPPIGSSEATANPGLLLADLYGSMDQRGRALAIEADKRRVAGLACTEYYQSLSKAKLQ